MLEQSIEYMAKQGLLQVDGTEMNGVMKEGLNSFLSKLNYLLNLPK